MIYLKLLKWSNCFSYGLDNSIDFTSACLTQLVGKNGHGKSSIPLILEEVLYNKNSKGIKKSDILNRYVKDKFYSIDLYFSKDSIDYKIETKRTSTQTVKLFKGEHDISAHTATATYKMIEDIVGMDHKTFAQIVYQSHAGSLEFLTSPDTARKKFLIELLNLGKYTKAGEVFKTVNAELIKELAVAQSKVDVVTQWISKYSSMDTALRPIAEVPEAPAYEESELVKLKHDLTNIAATNKKINQNNTYKKIQAGIELKPVPSKPYDNTSVVLTNKAEADKSIRDAETFKSKIKSLKGNCPTCFQAINPEEVANMITEQDAIIKEAKAKANLSAEALNIIRTAIAEYEKANNAQQEWEKYHQLIDKELTSELLDEKDLNSKIQNLEQTISIAKKQINDINRQNELANAHNSKVNLLKEQLAEMTLELDNNTNALAKLNGKLSIISILLKTFSTTGLVAYKIENLVKDLEVISNEYLNELSDGRFQISFQISGSDKLNVIITDNGIDIDINALSGGERARVNVATLLAIRNLMQSLSQSRINLLILDETVEALDVEGKERLIEVLLAEEALNTIIISHGFTHPLLDKLQIIKTNNISRIEE